MLQENLLRGDGIRYCLSPWKKHPGTGHGTYLPCLPQIPALADYTMEMAIFAVVPRGKKREIAGVGRYCIDKVQPLGRGGLGCQGYLPE